MPNHRNKTHLKNKERFLLVCFKTFYHVKALPHQLIMNDEFITWVTANKVVGMTDCRRVNGRGSKEHVVG